MNLTPDTKYLVAEKLTGKELVRLCSTDKEMRRLCSSQKFNKLWQDKLKKDYKVMYEGENAYMEYLQNTYFYNKFYWIVTNIDEDNEQPADSVLFKEKKDAVNYIADGIYGLGGDYPFSVIFAKLDSDGFINYGGFIYFLAQSKFYSKKQYDYVKEYDEKLKEIVEILREENNEEIEIDDLKDFLSDNEIDSYGKFIDKVSENYTISEKAEELIQKLYTFQYK
jgi:hypothetical protein